VFPIVRHAERTTGFFKIKGINIGHGEFEDLLFRQRALNDFRCEAITVHSEDVLRVFVELKQGCNEHAAMADLANAIRGAFELTPEICRLRSAPWRRNLKPASRRHVSLTGVPIDAPSPPRPDLPAEKMRKELDFVEKMR
jgi:hypothetical protein